MKVIKTTAEANETSATLDLFEGKSLSETQKQRIREEVGQFLVEQTLADVASETSPIEGSKWKRGLKGAYKKKKEEEIGNDLADIQFTGRTLDQYDFKPTAEGIKIGVFGERAPVADGHNNLSGKSELPQRRWIPGKEQKYQKDIQKEVERIVADVVAETKFIDENKFKKIETKEQLRTTLKEFFGDGMTFAEIRTAVFRNPRLLEIIQDEDLLDLL